MSFKQRNKAPDALWRKRTACAVLMGNQRNAVRSILAVAALMTSSVASATSPCPPGARCAPDEFAVVVAASLVAVEKVCARMDPPRKGQYAEALANMLETKLDAEDREAIRKAMQSPLFSDRLKQAELHTGEMKSDELARACASLLRLDLLK